MPDPHRPRLDFWAHAPHVYSLHAFRFLLREWSLERLAEAQAHAGQLPEAYAEVLRDEHLWRSQRRF